MIANIAREEYTAAQVLNRICAQGLRETDINGNEITAADVAADWGNYMFTFGMLLSAYLNGIITRREYDRASSLWYMLRYGNICAATIRMG